MKFACNNQITDITLLNIKTKKNMKNTNLKVGSIVKINDFGIVKSYTLVKQNTNGDFNLQAAGTISFDASVKWINENSIE